MPRTINGFLFEDVAEPTRWLHQTDTHTDSGEWFGSVAEQIITVMWMDGDLRYAGHIVEKISHQNIIGRSAPITTRSWTISDPEGQPITGTVHFHYSDAVEELIWHGRGRPS